MKLTETQRAILEPIIEQYNKSRLNLETSLVLLAGKNIKNWKYEKGELTFEEVENDSNR